MSKRNKKQKGVLPRTIEPRMMRTRSLLDVVIVTGGRFDMLTKCLNALYEQAEDVPISIYIVDQNTNPVEREQNKELFVKRADSKVVDFRVKRLADVGFATANNEGSRMGMAPLIMFLNDDVQLLPGAIAKVVETMNDQTIGICGIKLLFPPDSLSPIRPAGKIQHVGMAFNIRGEAVHPLVGWTATHPKASVSRDVLMVTGACLTIRRSLFLQVNGFDPIYGMGTFEDCDLCLKVVQKSMRVYVTTDAIGYHYAGSTAEKKQVPFPLGQNRMTFQARWGSTGFMQWTDWVILKGDKA